jgi:hypothetical protein
VAQRPGTTGADVLAGLSGAPSTAALSVRTTVCPPGFGGGKIAESGGWARGAALADHLGTFVALVDFGGEGQPGVWVIPSTTMRQHFATLEEPKPYRCRASAEELTPYEEDWDAVEDYLLGVVPTRRGGSTGRRSRNATARSSWRRWTPRPRASWRLRA